MGPTVDFASRRDLLYTPHESLRLFSRCTSRMNFAEEHIHMGIELKDRVAIVTGGANGIGRETSRAFARAGAAVAVWDMAAEAGQAVAAEIA